MKNILLIITIILSTTMLIFSQGVMDVYIDDDNPYAPRPGKVKMVGGVTSSTFNSPLFIHIAADGTEGKTELQIKNMIPHPPIGRPFDELTAEIFSVEGFDQLPEYYGEITSRYEDNGKLILNYNHPKEFHPNYIDENHYTFDVTLSAWEVNFETNDSTYASYTRFRIGVYRPPVLFVHGLWSSGESFKTMEERLYHSRQYGVNGIMGSHTLRADYHPTNASFFLANQGVVPQAISQLLQGTSKVIASKVDVVCHSMGGILTRLYLQNTLTPYADNIHRLITVNTPHSGAQSANLLLDDNVMYKGAPLGRDYVCAYGPGAGFGSCYEGAVSDLQVGMSNNGVGSLLNASNLNANTVPSFAITTEELFSNTTSGHVTGYHPWARTFSLFFDPKCFDAFFLDVFDGEKSDLIVAKSSQKGGLPFSSTQNHLGQMHNGSTANPLVIDHVKNLLNRSSQEPIFYRNGFDPPTLNYNSSQIHCTKSRTSYRNNSDSEINISGPNEGLIIEGGSDFSVALGMSNDVVETMIIMEGNAEKVFVSKKQKGITNHVVHLDSSLIGYKSITAIGFDDQHLPVAISQPIDVLIETSATLDSISMYPNVLLMGDNGYSQLRVYGHYSDSVKRQITHDMNLEYSFKHNVGQHEGNGKVIGQEIGIDTLVVKIGELKSELITVHVVKAPDLSTSTNYQADQKVQASAEINVYPNPTRLGFHTDLPLGAKLEIFTLDGKLLWRNTITKIDQFIDTSSFRNGLYILRVINKEKLFQGKVIVL